MLSEMGSVDAVPHYLARVKDPKDSFCLMGFGHRVYKAYDPRAKIMRQITHQVRPPRPTRDCAAASWEPRRVRERERESRVHVCV